MIENENAFVIVVDDDDTHLNMVSFMLRRMGIAIVESFSNADDALARAMEKCPDLIVSDWNMEPMDGLQLLKLVRRNSQTTSVPFIMATANITEGHWRQAIETGVTEFMFKPLSYASLREAVSDTLSQAPSGRRNRIPKILTRLKTR